MTVRECALRGITASCGTVEKGMSGNSNGRVGVRGGVEVVEVIVVVVVVMVVV